MDFRSIAATLKASGYPPRKADARIAHDIVLKAIEDADFHDKGLNIIGVDVWDKVENHKEAVQKLGIAYPQLIDTTGTATEQYGIVGIPAILLLDRNGIIVKRDLRGDDIEAAVVAALGLE